MKVGILSPIRFSVFSSGASSVALNLYDYLRELGYETELLNILPSDKNWYDDCSSLQSKYIVKSASSKIEEKYDLVIDIDGFMSAEVRTKLGKKVAVLLRKPVILSDIECIVYPTSRNPRILDNIDFTIVYDYFADSDIDYVKLLTNNKPVYRVPFLWRPTVIQAHYSETGFRPWSGGDAKSWHPHVMETNMTNTSSCTVPLVTLRQVAEKSNFPYKEYTIHNMDQLNNSDYFRDNIKKNSEIIKAEGHFIGRQRVVDLVVQPKSLLLSHIRFLPFRPIHIDAAWVGLPIIHNSVLLREIGCGYERLFYRDNDILGAVRCFEVLEKDYAARSGIFSEGGLMAVRKRLERFMGLDNSHKNAWLAVLSNTTVTAPQTIVAVAPQTPPVTVAPQTSVVVPQTPPVTVAPQTSPVAAPQTSTKQVLVLFTDMWDDFNPEYNFFLLLLENSSKNFSSPPRIKGYSLETLGNIIPDILIFGPFGESWQLYPDLPKVHFTGENTPAVNGPNVKLNLGYSLIENAENSYIRLPLWILEIDWFNADPEKIRNPKPLPIDCVRKTYPEMIEQHSENFCSFVVTNPRNPIRNDAFVWLSMYKHVDSAGRLFNNIGDKIYAGLGGGGGELKKHEFLKNYKFSLCYENSSAEGYTTEKLLHAKAAGCIPIYWGDPKVSRDFDDAGFINAQNASSPEELIELVRKIDENDELYKKMYNTPLLDEYKFNLIRRRLSQIATKFWSIFGYSEDTLKTIPKFVGNSESVVKTPTQTKTQQQIKFETSDAHIAIQKMVAVTFATKNFTQSLQMWLHVMKQHKQQLPELVILVYRGHDVDNVETLTENNPGIKFLSLPTETPIDFSDFWHPQHFAWKLWILNEVCGKYENRLIFYMDCASLLVRFPFEYISSVLKNGLCFLEDSRQTNLQWCSSEFCEALSVTEKELSEKQIWAGGFAFVVNEQSRKFFTEALTLGSQRHIIVGPKWAGQLPDGRPKGHRHDQSIISILSLRYGLTGFSLDSVYCDFSLRKTLKTGCSLYVHRGQFANHKATFNRISEIHMINLKRRKDRLDLFYNSHPYMNGQLIVDAACDGRATTMTPALSRLFKPNDFMWKKAIFGCAMSHLKLWIELANEDNNIENYLILEDDVKFAPGWENIWNQASQMIPDDYDVLYLGGILPPNRQGYKGVTEQVNMFWSRIKEHTMFGQSIPNRYFHVCNYSYILSKQGAQKIIASILGRGGYYTSADHMVCNQIESMKHYFMTPLVTGSYQDDDPKYANAEFNNFNRIDGFDSDLWNNDDRFSDADKALGSSMADISLETAIKDAFTPEVVIGETKQTPVEDTVPQKINAATNRCFYTIGNHKTSIKDMMEATWIRDLLNLPVGKTFGQPSKTITMEIKNIPSDMEPMDSSPIFIIQRPYIDLYANLFKLYDVAKKNFYVLHLSDEYGHDDISWYSLSYCKGIVRTYVRKFEEDVINKICIIPLGYNRRATEPIYDIINKTPALPFRELVWSFRGTRWMNREAKLESLKQIPGDNRCIFYNDWKDPLQVEREEYVGEVLNSKFVACPGGMNAETFRFYEALELGAIPLYVRQEGDELYFKKLTETIPVLSFGSWVEASAAIQYFLQNPDIMDRYRGSLLIGWANTKKIISNRMKTILGF